MKKLWAKVWGFLKNLWAKLWGFLKRRCTNKCLEDDHQAPLTPTVLDPNDKCYKSVYNLARKLQAEDVLNIALTGPYGSGKSTVFRTLRRDFLEYKYLTISLATLESELGKKQDDEVDIDTMNNRIEYSILQQLIYKEKQETLYNSRFKRIYHKPNWAQYVLSIAIIFYVVSLIIVFEPSFLRVEWICQRLSDPTLNRWADVISIGYLFLATIIFAQKLIKSLGNSKLNRLNLKSGEIELKENKEDGTSIFNKHMDEIVYFFQVTKYNVVIIEDLDRFKNAEIFCKLREVNYLLNQSKAVGRKIVFIYAVRDDMFVDADRTKFFDYITTVIPIINSSNSAEKLREELEKKGVTGIDSDVIDNVAFFIDDMRLLKNIVNEYAQYREKLDEKLDQNKLLAMIVYKNHFPKDFADLHKGKGVLYECLRKKNALLEDRNSQIDKRIEEINKKLQCKEATHALQEKELRLVYMEGYRKQILKLTDHRVLFFLFENNHMTPEDIAESETAFNSFTALSTINYRTHNGSYLADKSLNINFSQIENIVNSDFTYRERLEALRKDEDEYREQIRLLELSRNNHYATPIQELLQNIDVQEHAIFKGMTVPKMLESFLKEGLINEDYFDYISFFFGKSITKHDHDFVLDLKLRHSLQYDYPIDNAELCVKNIPDKCYNDVSILNIQIVDYICQHINEESNKAKLHAITQTIKKYKQWDFLSVFYNSVENAEPFFKHLAVVVDGVWKVFAKINTNKLYGAWFRFLELNHSTKESRNWLEMNYEFLARRVELIGFDTIKQIISNGNLVFETINAESYYLLEYIIENKAYALTPENVACAFIHCRNGRVESLENYPLNITILKDCEPAKPVWDYIYEYLDDALNDVFVTDAAKQESAEVIAEIMNSEDITEETTRKYLSGQTNKVSLSVVNEDLWEMAMELDIITPSWSEIYVFYENQGNVIVDKLYTFITGHIDELTDISELDNAQKETLANSILLTSEFEISVYDKLVKIFAGVVFEDVDISNVDNARLKSLLSADMLPYSTYYTAIVRDHHNDVLVYYVDKYLDECIDAIEELPTIKGLYKHLMRNSRVFGDKALKVVQHFLPYIEWDSELADMTLPVVKSNLEEFDYDTEKRILSESTNQQEQLSFLGDLIEKYKADFDRITDLLTLLGEPYSNITDKSKKASIELNETNKMLLQKLQAVGYISSYSEQEDKLRVNHKRNSN